VTKFDILFDKHRACNEEWIVQDYVLRRSHAEKTHYYPFGLIMSGLSSKSQSFGKPENVEKTFQGQRIDYDLDLNWVHFKWRNHDPQIGRFIEVDPLSNKYVYNSTYAFSENLVTNHIELEGLEATAAGYFQYSCAQLTAGLANAIDRITGFEFGKTDEIVSPPNSNGTSIAYTEEKKLIAGSNFSDFINAGFYSRDNNMPNIVPYMFQSRVEKTSKVEFVQTNKAGTFETETRVAADGTSASVKVSYTFKKGGVPVLLQRVKEEILQ
jgi:RHS repeat-associated protein